MAADLDRILAPGYVEGLEGLDLDEVRARRAECQEVETGLSLVRRLAQGRLDIVAAEQARRAGASAGTGPSEDTASEDAASEDAGVGRLSQLLAPAELPEDLAAEVDAALPPVRLAQLATLADDELAATAERLGELEREVSERRRRLFERVDALQAELTRRYRTGEASPDTLLS